MHRAFVLLIFAVVGGCDFFRELQDEESAGDDTTGDGGDAASSGTGTGTDTGTEAACEVATDDRCVDQDRLASCDPETGQLSQLDCSALCGQNVNLSCVLASSGQHGCFCVAPGAQKVIGCGDLDACVARCSDGAFGSCADACYGRTDTETVRLFGALLFCAQDACEPVCAGNPSTCEGCLTAALAGTGGGCQVERSVCDQDRSDEPEWP